jgi:hypothetical protein
MNAFIGDFWRANVHFVFNDDSLYECIFLIFWFQFINAFLGENCIRIYSSQWSKNNAAVETKTHYLRFKHFIITITDDPSPC